MPSDNLFLALSKYDRKRSSENYLTEAFAYLLRYLLKHEPALGVHILNRLCGVEDGFLPDDAEKIVVATQTSTEEGIPDITISAPGKLVRIEVKKESWPHEGQLKRYAADLDRANADFKALVLLTRYDTEVPADVGRPVHRVRWFEIHDWLEQAQLDSPVAGYLARQFARFLEASQMTIQRVGWELAPGIVALKNFVAMLGAAIEAAGLKEKQRQITFARGYFGCYIEGSKFWCGLGYDRPLPLWFQEYDCPRIDKDMLKNGPYPLKHTSSGHEAYTLNLEDEDVAFFALSKEKQLAKLAGFIKWAYDRFKKAEAAAGAGEVTTQEAGRESDDETR